MHCCALVLDNKGAYIYVQERIIHEKSEHVYYALLVCACCYKYCYKFDTEISIFITRALLTDHTSNYVTAKVGTYQQCITLSTGI